MIINIIIKAFRNKSHTSHSQRPGLKLNQSKEMFKLQKKYELSTKMLKQHGSINNPSNNM